MSNATPSRPASLISILAICGCFALFLLLIYLADVPKEVGPYAQIGSRTPAERKEKLAELRANEASHSSYAWIDQSTGQVQLPIERAMELTVQRYQRN